MPDQLINRILRIIEEQAKKASAYPDYVRFMRLALFNNRPDATGRERANLVALPGMCCQAAGGQPEQADRITAAWLCFYQAAHLMDSVQDRDEPEPWWADKGPALALNVASGLYFTASLILQRLYQMASISHGAEDIIHEFYRSFFVMNNGQYRELTSTQMSLEQYWQNAIAKSGAFFALACWSGARLVTNNPVELDRFRSMGENLGVLIQVKDDLEEFHSPSVSGSAGQGPKLGYSLPVIYAKEVLPQEMRWQLSSALEATPTQPDTVAKVIRILDESGASTYISIQIDRHRQQAIDALLAIEPELSINPILYDFILSL